MGREDIFNGVASKAAQKRLPAFQSMIARRKLDQPNQAVRLSDLKAPPKNRLEALRRDRTGQSASRINDHYSQAPEAADIRKGRPVKQTEADYACIVSNP